jgi:uncharacterized lipoprotein NlpE involved in copper resistance
MKIVTRSLKQKSILVLLSAIVFNPVIAKTDKDVSTDKKTPSSEHKNHSKHTGESKIFHGVYYGFLPCKDCEGTKTTLSLKNRNNYLLVTQPAKKSAREFFEKGKYRWDEDAKLITLTSRKKGEIKKYQINDEKRITQLSPEGKSLKSKQKNTSYILHKNEMKQKNGGGGHMH